jgi:hypothetical protein
MENAGSGRRIEPRLSGQLDRFMERLKSGTHGGEPFELTLMDAELEEAVAWYSLEHSGFPLTDARVSIRPDGIEVRGEARAGAARVPLSARAEVSLNEGVPAVAVNQIQVGEMGLPDFLRFELEDRVNRYLALIGRELPVFIDEIELFDGRFTVRGKIR